MAIERLVVNEGLRYSEGLLLLKVEGIITAGISSRQ